MAQIRTWEKREADLDNWSDAHASDKVVLDIEGEASGTLERLEVILELRSVQEVEDMLNSAI